MLCLGLRRFPYCYYLVCTAELSSDVAPKRSVIFAVIEATFTDGFQFAFAIPCASVATVIAPKYCSASFDAAFWLPKLNFDSVDLVSH